MKKFALTLLLCGIAATLSACSGNYKKMQTVEQQNAPYTCAGLHMRNAQWHFDDDYGQHVDVIGNCAKGMKHGTFEFYIEGQLIAKTKYIRDNENKTTCLAQGKSRLDLNSCMKIKAELSKSETNSNAIHNVIESADAPEEAEENIEQDIQ